MAEEQFSSRLARSSDRDNIARLCRRAVGRHDYVLGFLDQMISEKRLFVVLARSGELIGMSSYTPVFDRSGWLGMARTDPAWRGRGVAQFLQKSIANYARKRGIRKLRFFVLSTNTSSLRAARKGGFKAVAHASHLRGPLKTSRAPRNIWRLEQKAGPINVREVLNSSCVSKMNGYLRYGYAFVKANEANLRYMLRRKKLLVYPECSFILKIEEDHAEFSILTGSLRASLHRIAESALRLKSRSLGGFVPYDHYAIRVCKSSGFRQDSWGKHVILFERSI